MKWRQQAVIIKAREPLDVPFPILHPNVQIRFVGRVVGVRLDILVDGRSQLAMPEPIDAAAFSGRHVGNIALERGERLTLRLSCEEDRGLVVMVQP